MAVMFVQTNMSITDEIASLIVLYWDGNFKSCNKLLRLIMRHIGHVTIKIPINKLLSQINIIWRNRVLEIYKQLILNKSK